VITSFKKWNKNVSMKYVREIFHSQMFIYKFVLSFIVEGRLICSSSITKTKSRKSLVELKQTFILYCVLSFFFSLYFKCLDLSEFLSDPYVH
jgi:hypothetical protein